MLVGKDHRLQAPRTHMLAVLQCPGVGWNTEMTSPSQQTQTSLPFSPVTLHKGLSSGGCIYTWALPCVHRTKPVMSRPGPWASNEASQFQSWCEDSCHLGNHSGGTAETGRLVLLGLPGSSCSNLPWSRPFQHPVPHHCHPSYPPSNPF